eukprot:1985669-Prymnesium_polylepis.1
MPTTNTFLPGVSARARARPKHFFTLVGTVAVVPRGTALAALLARNVFTQGAPAFCRTVVPRTVRFP